MLSVLETAKGWMAAGAWADALACLEAVPAQARTAEVLLLMARVLRRLDRPADAAMVFAEVFTKQPENSIVAHNLAAALGDAGDHEGAIAGAHHALLLHKRAETWLVLGRSLIAIGELHQAQQALSSAIDLQPGYRDALRELSQLIWMRTRDPMAALAPLQAALASNPSCELAAMTGGIIRELGTPQQAYDLLKPWMHHNSTVIHLAAASSASKFDTALQLEHAAAALALAPAAPEARNGWAAALLCAGKPAEALSVLDAWLRQAPRDQYARALRYAGLRMGGLQGQLLLDDYRRLVGIFDIPVPPAWNERSTWLGEISEALHRLHAFSAEPFGQSVRHGAQSRMDPRFAGDRAIDAAFAAFARAVRDYSAERRNESRGETSPDLDISGAWSVRLSSGGHHNDHIHPAGQLSSAFYVEVPKTGNRPREGWLRFGGFDLGGLARLDPEYWVEPRPGRLVLFPSYLWHGTEPFSGEGYRLSIAFDARPRT